MRRLAVSLFIVLTFFFLLIPSRVEAGTNWMIPTASEFNQYLSDNKNGQLSSEGSMLHEMVTVLPFSAICGLSGMVCGAQTQAELTYNMDRSVLSQGGGLINTLYQQPPASTAEYLAYTFNKAGLVPKAYAQGVTYSRLLPILPIWKAFRDVSYIVLTLVMMLIGFMIMFRAKVNPQTVANVESTLPKVVVTLILITFSFPIASLIIDFSYVMIAAGVGIIGTAVGDPYIAQVKSGMTNGGFGSLVWYTFAPVGQYISNSWQQTVGSVSGGGAGAAVGSVLSFLGPTGWIIGLVAGLIGAGATGTYSGTGGFEAGTVMINALNPILIVVIMLVLLFSLFRIFFMLLASYIQVVVFIALAPAILLVNAFPGQSTFSYWWKSIFSNMLSFVVTAIMLYLGWAITNKIGTEPFWTAPFIMQGAGISQMVSALIALGMVLLIPQMVQLIKGKFGAKPFAPIGPSMILAPVSGGATQALGLASQFHTASLGMGQLGGIAKRFGITVPGTSKP